MAKAFTYSRLPEHQVAVYYDGSDKTGDKFYPTELNRASKNGEFCNDVNPRFVIALYQVYFIFQTVDLDHQSGISWNVSSLSHPSFFSFSLFRFQSFSV